MRRRIVLRFLLSPLALHADERGHSARSSWCATSSSPAATAGLRAQRDRRAPRRSPAGLVFRAIGYRGMPLAGVPFDERRARDPQRGRPRAATPPAGAPLPGRVRRRLDQARPHRRDRHEQEGRPGDRRRDPRRPRGRRRKTSAPHTPAMPDAAAIEELLRARQPELVTYCRLGGDRPTRAGARRARRTPPRQAHADRARCCASPPPKRPRRRNSTASRRSERICDTVAPRAPLAHLVERRAFNPVGRVRVPHGAYPRTFRSSSNPRRWW